jgi:hypothetical protein
MTLSCAASNYRYADSKPMGGAANMATPNRAGKHGNAGVVGEVRCQSRATGTISEISDLPTISIAR